MSFKREGDDFSLLNIIKKRRVSELLANDIPNDEAYLMANGRFACCVCSHRPVFDTVDMLSVHRKGKKHAANQERYYRNQKEIADLKLKRAHEQYLKETERKSETGDEHAETSIPKLLAETRKTTQHALLKSAPYNSCVKHGRKEQVKGDNSAGKGLFFQSQKPHPVPVIPHPGPSGTVPGAYVSKRLQNLEKSSHVSGAVARTVSRDDPTDRTVSKTVVTRDEAVLASVSALPAHVILAPPPPPPPPPPEGAVELPRGDTTSRGSQLKQEDSNNVELQNSCDREKRRAEAEYYIKMKSSGWIMDHRNGKWVKDANVEFDSDEDEPPLFPPT